MTALTNTARELLVLRHGKSDWPSGMEDFDRPLKRRGNRAAARIGQWLVDNDLIPDFVISSPANRAIATTRRVCETKNLDPAGIQENRDIYQAELETLLKAVRDLPGSAQRAMIVGHNPGLEELLAALSKTDVNPYDESGRMSPCAIAVLRLSAPWAETAPRTATLLHLIRPSELPLES